MIANDEQLRNTQKKLESLEAHYREREQDPPSPSLSLSLQSLRRTINELTEEIARYRAQRDEPRSSIDRNHPTRKCRPLRDRESVKNGIIQDEFQLVNTQAKLKRLEELYNMERSGTPSRARDATLMSLKRMINQMKEEIAVFQAHEAAGSPNASSRN